MRIVNIRYKRRRNRAKDNLFFIICNSILLVIIILSTLSMRRIDKVNAEVIPSRLEEQNYIMDISYNTPDIEMILPDTPSKYEELYDKYFPDEYTQRLVKLINITCENKGEVENSVSGFDIYGEHPSGLAQFLPSTLKSVLPNGDVLDAEDSIHGMAIMIERGRIHEWECYNVIKNKFSL